MPKSLQEKIAEIEIELRKFGTSSADSTADTIGKWLGELAVDMPIPWRVFRKSICAVLRVASKISADDNPAMSYRNAAKVLERFVSRMEDLEQFEESLVIVGKEDEKLLDKTTQLSLNAFGQERLRKRYLKTRRDYFRELNDSGLCPFITLCPLKNIDDDHVIRLDPIGYTSVIPLAPGSAERWLAGKTSQYEWDRHDFETNRNSAGEKTIYLQAAYVEKERTRYGTYLLVSILKSLSRFLPDNWTPTQPVTLAAENYAEVTADVLGMLGFEQVAESKDGHEIWAITLDDTTVGTGKILIRSLLGAQSNCPD